MNGFTLIELLVVVLIIGILAAVALPQFQQAVEKSRAGSALVVGRAIMNAQEAYYMANGVYASSVEDLDIGVTCPKEFECVDEFMNNHGPLSNNYKYEMYRWGRKSGEFQLIFNFDQRKIYDFAGRIYCYAPHSNAKAKSLCLSLGKGKSTDTGGGIRIFIE